MWVTVTEFFPLIIAYTIPILVTSLGGLYSERSGFTNIGLEGLMLVGYFASAITLKLTEATLGINALPVGLLVGVAAGAVFSLLLAIASIHLHSDLMLSGMAINMLAGALTVFQARTILGSATVRISMGIAQTSIPFLSKIPIIGPLFFSQSYWTTWLCLLIWALSWILLYNTSFGLRLRACGEHPSAVASAGANVSLMRYFGVVMSGALAGLGGAVILVTYSGVFSGTAAGVGFLSLAALVFGQRKPLGILGTSFVFGIATSIASNPQGVPLFHMLSPALCKMLPYIVALLVLVIFSKKSTAPKAMGDQF